MLKRLYFAAALTLVLIGTAFATVNRQLPTSTTDPSGISGTSYADQVAEEVEALWRIGVEPLTSVAGTNTITATPLVSGSGFAAYAEGNRFSLVSAANNTGAVTINIASRGAKAIVTEAGSALTGGELVAGTLYTIAYDGTDFRLAASSYDLGAGINGATAKTTPVDADEFAISDSAASNVAKKVTLAELRTALGGGLALAAEQEPTSDVATIAQTGLSDYRDVTIAFALHPTDFNGDLHIDARTSGGTWRTIATIPDADGPFYGEVTIRNFGRANNIKILSGVVVRSDNTLDRSNATESQYTPIPDTFGDEQGSVAVAGYATYSEQWDEIRVDMSSGNFEGSTADARSYLAVYGEGVGD